MKTIVILENIKDAESFYRYRQNTRDNSIVIATSPGVCWELEKNGIIYKNVESYYDKNDIIKLGMNNFLTLNLLCNDIDSFLFNNEKTLKKFNLKPAQDNFFFIKLLYDGVSIRIKILEKIVEDEQPEKFIAFSYDQDSITHHARGSEAFSDEERLFSLILPLSKYHYELISAKKDELSPDKKKRSPVFDRGNHKKLIEKNILYDILYTSKKYGLICGCRLGYDAIKNTIKNRMPEGGGNLVISGFAYNWNYLLPTLYSKGYSIYHYEKDYKISNLGEIPLLGKEIQKLIEKYCIKGDINFSPIIIKKFLPVLTTSIAEAATLAYELDHSLKKINPRAILCSIKIDSRDHMIAHVSKLNQIPVITWQHGDQGVREQVTMTQYSEIMNSDYHFCFGEGTKQTLTEDPSYQYPCEIIPIGSLELQELFFNENHYKIEYSILYGTTNYYRNSFYINSPSILQDIRYWESQKKILDVLGKTNLPTAFKIHPVQIETAQFHQFIKNKDFGNIEIIQNQRSFLDLLLHADIAVLDYPSTTLLQAIASRKIVFVLLNQAILSEHAKKLLKKRAFCAENIDDFTTMIARHVNNLPLDEDPDIDNTDFLENFGIHKKDKNVARRAVSSLEKISKTHH